MKIRIQRYNHPQFLPAVGKDISIHRGCHTDFADMDGINAKRAQQGCGSAGQA